MKTQPLAPPDPRQDAFCRTIGQVRRVGWQVGALAGQPDAQSAVELHDHGIRELEGVHHRPEVVIPVGSSIQHAEDEVDFPRRRHFDTAASHPLPPPERRPPRRRERDRKSTRLNSSHGYISYAVFCLKKKKQILTDDNQALTLLHTVLAT